MGLVDIEALVQSCPWSCLSHPFPSPYNSLEFDVASCPFSLLLAGWFIFSRHLASVIFWTGTYLLSSSNLIPHHNQSKWFASCMSVILQPVSIQSNSLSLMLKGCCFLAFLGWVDVYDSDCLCPVLLVSWKWRFDVLAAFPFALIHNKPLPAYPSYQSKRTSLFYVHFPSQYLNASWIPHILPIHAINMKIARKMLGVEGGVVWWRIGHLKHIQSTWYGLCVSGYWLTAICFELSCLSRLSSHRHPPAHQTYPVMCSYMPSEIVCWAFHLHTFSQQPPILILSKLSGYYCSLHPIPIAVYLVSMLLIPHTSNALYLPAQPTNVKPATYLIFAEDRAVS